MSKCDHGSGDKFKTIVTVYGYDGVETGLTLRQCDLCKAFSIKLYRIKGSGVPWRYLRPRVSNEFLLCGDY